MNQLTPIAREVFGFTRSRQQTPLQQVIDLVKKGELQKALEIADTLSPEDRDKIPDSILFKLSQLAEIQVISGAKFDQAINKLSKPPHNMSREKAKAFLKKHGNGHLAEMSMTGIGASFSGGSGEGVATKYTFGKKKKKKKIIRKKLASMAESKLTNIAMEVYSKLLKN